MTPEHFALYKETLDALCEDARSLVDTDPELWTDFGEAALALMRARNHAMKRETEHDT